MAVLADGEVLATAAGVADAATGRALTDDTAFRLGSLTKVFTATAAMVLVERGDLDLDSPIPSYVPEFTLADPAAAGRITMRQLLTHSSGIDAGDWFVDGGSGPDACARYVAALATRALISEPGELCSYCNGGLILAGHVIERLTGVPWDVALRDLVLAPAGLKESFTILQEDVAAVAEHRMSSDNVPGHRRLAAGHTAGPDGRPKPVAVSPMASVWGRATAPAGSSLSATVSDMVRFARVHVDADAGLLGDVARGEMQRPHIPLPLGRTDQDGQGLGWGVANWNGVRTLSHGGGHLGFETFLLALPDHRAAVALATNHTPQGSMAMFRLLAPVFQELTGGAPPAQPRPADPPPVLDATRYVGAYGRAGVALRVEADADGLKCVGLGRMKAVDEEWFVAGATQLRFARFDTSGVPRYLYAGARVHRRDFHTDLPQRSQPPRSSR